MLELQKGKFRVRLAGSDGDLNALMRLRADVFRRDANADDSDRFDPLCRQILIEDITTDRLVGGFRVMELPNGRDIATSYAAQTYDLRRLLTFDKPMLELGRLCIAPDLIDNPNILRVAWAALTRHVDEAGIGLFFGCSSFPGTNPADFAGPLTLLKQRYLAPDHLAPLRKSKDVFDLNTLPDSTDDARAAAKAIPPMLKTYLTLGGWVGDHAVIDRDLGTLHVFTCVEVCNIPPSRARALRAVAG